MVGHQALEVFVEMIENGRGPRFKTEVISFEYFLIASWLVRSKVS